MTIIMNRTMLSGCGDMISAKKLMGQMYVARKKWEDDGRPLSQAAPPPPPNPANQNKPKLTLV